MASGEAGVGVGVGSSVEASASLVFHGEAYAVTVGGGGEDAEVLEVAATRQETGEVWRGSFTRRYVEDITAKTGSYKRFGVFARMLATAVAQEHESVFVDLLTYADLEALRQRRLAAAGGEGAPAAAPDAAAAASASNKRYLILTYAGEFDRVHYPLPLLYDDKPDVAGLRQTIADLRKENERLRGPAARGGALGREPNARGDDGGAAARRLREENAKLRAQLEQFANSPYAGPAPERPDGRRERELEREVRLVRKERDILQARVSSAEAEIENERKAARRRAAKDRKEVNQLTDDLERSRAQCREARALHRRSQMEVEDLRKRLARAQQARGGAPPRGAPPKPRGTGAGHRGGGASGGRTGAPYRAANSAPASRSSSRRTSAASSPAGSRRNSRSPSPAPVFDPTAYVMQKREKLAELAARRARSASPSSSRGASPSRRSAASDAESDGAPRRGLTRRAPSSGAPPARRAHRLDAPAPRKPPVPGASVGGAPKRRVDDKEVDRIHRLSTRGGSAPAGEKAGRSSSPGRALKDVQRKLQEYANQGRDAGQDKAPKSKAPAAPEDVSLATSREIADIDSRLHALQNFLRHAKGTPGAGAGASAVAVP